MPREWYWGKISEVLSSLPGPFTLGDIYREVSQEYEAAKRSTIRRKLESVSVNIPSEHFPEVGLRLVYLGGDLFDHYSRQAYPDVADMSMVEPFEESHRNWMEEALGEVVSLLNLKDLTLEARIADIRVDAIGRLATGQYVVLEFRRSIGGPRVWAIVDRMHTARERLAESFDTSRSMIVLAIVSQTLPHRVRSLLVGSDIAFITTTPRPEVQLQGGLHLTGPRSDFSPQRLRHGHWLVVGATGSGKTNWLQASLFEISRAGSIAIVIGSKEEYDMNEIPPGTDDYRVVQMATGRTVRLEEFRDWLSPIEMEMLRSLIKTQKVSASDLPKARKLTRQPLDEFAEETSKELRKSLARMTERINQLRAWLDSEGTLLGIQIEEDSDFETKYNALQFLHSFGRDPSSQSALVAIDPLDTLASDGKYPASTIGSLERLLRGGRKYGLSTVLVTQSLNDEVARLIANISGIVAFRTADPSTLAALAAFSSSGVAGLRRMLSQLRTGDFLVLTPRETRAYLSELNR